MSAALNQNVPPSYENYSNYPNQPPNQPEFQYQQPVPITLYPQPLPPPSNTPQVTVISQQPSTVTVQTIPILGPAPVTITCNQCFAFVTTSTRTEISTRTHCCALGLCLIGLWPCIVLPYICGGCCKKTIHSCPNCNAFIGSY